MRGVGFVGVLGGSKERVVEAEGFELGGHGQQAMWQPRGSGTHKNSEAALELQEGLGAIDCGRACVHEVVKQFLVDPGLHVRASSQ